MYTKLSKTLQPGGPTDKLVKDYEALDEQWRTLGNKVDDHFRELINECLEKDDPASARVIANRNPWFVSKAFNFDRIREWEKKNRPTA
jgi:hypothetical protein